ncbi:MAG: ankyrin repeat domain-containing protein [Fuerstiella sp.]
MPSRFCPKAFVPRSAVLLFAAIALLITPPSSAVADDFVKAAELQQFAKLAELLAGSADVNRKQNDGTTALHWVVYHDDESAVNLLLKHGADANSVNQYGSRPLALACTNGNASIVRKLLNAGADPAARLPGDETMLMIAARTGRPSCVELLLTDDTVADINARDQSGQTALMWAAAEGHAEVVDLLLSAGADPAISLSSGFSAFFFAVRQGNLDVVRVLLNAGQDVNAVMTPKRSGGKAVRKGTSGLVLAVENGHYELAAALIDAGADLHDQRSGFTALHALTWARKPNRGDGADGEPAPQGSGNVTSLQFVRRVVEAGFDLNTRLHKGRSGRGVLNQTGATVFFMAADTADIALMKLLLELGADPTIPNADQATALHAAAGLGTKAPGEEAGTEEEALPAGRLLLELGFDVNAVDQNGETPMHGAAYASWPKMAQLLADRGADIKIWHRKNKYGWTPLLIAQGHRPGNFKPAAATIDSIERIMKSAGVQPEAAGKFKGGNEYRTAPKPSAR